ncbi:MAG: hypothetical protein K2Z81_10040, partial [Cyanobacteria bacterium]|nr:hypothetical protein [Cyanobacteriota bacterium]
AAEALLVVTGGTAGAATRVDLVLNDKFKRESDLLYRFTFPSAVNFEPFHKKSYLICENINHG